MFCPKCGKAEQTPNAYCRACGEYLPDFNKPKRFRLIGETPEENVNQSLGYIIPSTIFALFTTIVLYAMFFGWVNDRGLIAFAAACSLCILIWQFSNIFVALKMRRRLKSRKNPNRSVNNQSVNKLNPPSTSNNALPAADVANFVRPGISVTENTTSLLEHVPAKNTQNLD